MRIWTRKSALIQPRTSLGKSDGVVAAERAIVSFLDEGVFEILRTVQRKEISGASPSADPESARPTLRPK